MDKSKQTDDEADIAEERYKGPGVLAAAAGEGVVSHFKWAFIGLLAGGLGGAILHKPVNGFIEKAQNLAANGVSHPSALTRWPSKTLRFIVGHGSHSADIIALKNEASKVVGKLNELGIKKALHEEKGMFYSLADEIVGLVPWTKDIKKSLMEGPSGDRFNAAVTTGGMLASIGYFLVPILSAGKGSAKAHEGKRQLERAQEEIIRLRNQNASQATSPTGEQTTASEPTSDKKTAEPAPEVTEKKIESVEKKPDVTDTAKLKGDSGWAESIQAQKDAKASAEPALA